MIYLAFPCYGNPHPEAAKQFWAHAINPCGKYRKIPCIKNDRGSSLLPEAFNWHWANAWNLQQNQGKPITHFAMLHSDVVPADWWLDTLLDAIIETGADLVAATIAIKDLRGLTSTAIDDPRYEGWEVTRRLTVREFHQLPEIYSAADCGYPDNYLLANTGCWICDFTRPWRLEQDENGWLKSFFEVRSGIHIDLGGTARTCIAPEDWNFSRKLGAMGCKVLCTRRLTVRHMGDAAYSNDSPWGNYEYDQEHANNIDSPIGSTLPAVPGWLTSEEGICLEELARGKTVLEIGSYCGRSTICLARTANAVFAVDTFDGQGTPNPQETLEVFQQNLDRYGVTNVETLVGRSEEVIPTLTEIFDVAFIDGAHDYESVQRDIELSLSVLNPDGILAFHDFREYPGEYDGRWDPGVTQAVKELIQSGAKVVARAGSILVVHPKKRKFHCHEVSL